MAKKLSPAKRAEILKNAHLPMRDIARHVGVSVGTVHGVLRDTPQAPPAALPEASDAPAEGEPTASPAERLNRSLAALERAARQASEGGDVARVIQAQRAIADLTRLMAHLYPAPPSAEKGVFVTKAESEAQSKKSQSLFMQAREAAILDAATWPACPHCSRGIPPTDMRERLAEMSPAQQMFSIALMGVPGKRP